MATRKPDTLEGHPLLLLDEATPSLALVRRWTTETLTDLGEDDLDDCLLVVTELVSNAYDHARGPRQLRLIRSPHPCSVRVEVDDGSLDQPVLGRSRISDSRGRGMVIVDRLSEDWGVVPHDHHKTVWAEISCTEPAPLRGIG